MYEFMLEYAVFIAMVFIFIMAIVFVKVADAVPCLQRYGSKKFIVSLVLLCGGFFLTWSGSIAGADCVWIFGLVGSGYGFSNIADKKVAVIPTPGIISRKFLITMIILATTIILTNYGRMGSSSAIIAMGIAGGVYGLTNTLEKKNALVNK